MKNKIYSKLFEFVDPKLWYLSGSSLQNDFYKEYRLEFKKNDLGWVYKLYSYYSYSTDKYDKNACYKGFVTLNISGKVLMTCVYFGLIVLLECLFTDFSFKFTLFNCLIYTLNLCIAIFLSFTSFSIFNWKIYRALRKAQYNILNKEAIREKEENEKLEQDIVKIVNDTIAKNPKLARKMKIKTIEKKNL